MEFSKRIYIFNIVLVVFVIIASLLIVVFSGRLGITDLSPLSVVCTSAFAELGITSGFYSNKAKAENVLKISKQIENENLKSENIEIANQIIQ